jgi:hypothetical protein
LQSPIGPRRELWPFLPLSWSANWNGYRDRDIDARAGTTDVALAELRQGSCVPQGSSSAHRAEQALTSGGDPAVCWVSRPVRMNMLVKSYRVAGGRSRRKSR